MPPSKWDDEDEESTPPSSPPAVNIQRRSKFDDEEDSDVLESWDAEEDSDVERETAKKAAEAKAKAEAEAKAKHKPRSQRVQEHIQANLRRKQELEAESSEEEEDEATRRARLRKTEKESDLRHAEDLFGELGISNQRSGGKHITLQDPHDPGNMIDLSALGIFKPNTKDQFTKLREILVPLISANAKKGPYVLFLQDFTKQLAKELPSDQIKKIASSLTTLSNEKLKEEKAAEKGGKKKSTKSKASLVANRDISFKADTTVYDDFADDDFM